MRWQARTTVRVVNGETGFSSQRYNMQDIVRSAVAGLPLGQGTNAEIEAAVVAQLSAFDLAEIAGRADKRSLYNGIASAKSNLKNKGELEQPSQGVWYITELGRRRLRQPEYGAVARSLDERQQLDAASDENDAAASTSGRYRMQELVRRAIAGLDGGQGTNQQIENAVRALLGESATSDISMRPDSHSLYNGVASAKSILKGKGDLVQTGRGLWKITELGKERLGVPSASGALRSRAPRLIELWPAVPSNVSGAIDLAALSTAAVVALYPRVLAELKRRGTIATNSNLVGEYAERLVADALGGTLQPPATRGHDVDVAELGRIQVKARMVSTPKDNGQLQLGIIRGNDITSSFEWLAVVLFNDELQVARAVLLPVAVVEGLLGPMVPHTNGRTVHATDATMFHPQARDITSELRQAAQQLETHSSGCTG